MINRRQFVKSGIMATLTAITPQILAAAKVKKLLFIHGRGQQNLNPDTLKSEWLDALKLGAQSAGLALPPEVEVAFPYYGDLLEKFTRQYKIPLTPDIQLRGDPVDYEFLTFQAQVAEEIKKGAGITDAQVEAEYGANPQPRGPLNWEWVQSILRAIDKHGGGLNQAILEAFTRDVYLYTTRSGVRDAINRVITAVLTDEPTVVVAHSLGTVVAYNILRTDRRTLNIPLFVTVGSPLGLRAIRDQLTPTPLRFPTPPVAKWYNAFDHRDVVALYPLDSTNFPVNPSIENNSTIKNRTDNRHGIVGYLDDPNVAKLVIRKFSA